MRPNYGNKRVYLEGEEKYHFPGGENGEEWREGSRRAGRRKRGGVRETGRAGQPLVGDGGALPLCTKVRASR